jgi:hypothetical protein
VDPVGSEERPHASQVEPCDVPRDPLTEAGVHRCPPLVIGGPGGAVLVDQEHAVGVRSHRGGDLGTQDRVDVVEVAGHVGVDLVVDAESDHPQLGLDDGGVLPMAQASSAGVLGGLPSGACGVVDVETLGLVAVEDLDAVEEERERAHRPYPHRVGAGRERVVGVVAVAVDLRWVG